MVFWVTTSLFFLGTVDLGSVEGGSRDVLEDDDGTESEWPGSCQRVKYGVTTR